MRDIQFQSARGKRSSKSRFIDSSLSINSSNRQPLYSTANLENPRNRGTEKASATGRHTALCEELLPLLKGWEATFIGQLLQQRFISCIQETKLARIAERHLRLDEKSQSKYRLCRHCGKSAQLIDAFSYHCDRCGVCLNLQWEEV